jgi:nicotinamidase-related amidase
VLRIAGILGPSEKKSMKKILLCFVIVVLLLFGFAVGVFLPFSAVTKGTPVGTYSAPRTALLIIDIQKDMTEESGKRPLNLPQTNSIISVVNQLIQNAGKKDWLVVYITHEYQKKSALRLVTKDFLLEGMPGAGVDPRLTVINQNHFIKQRMDAFSNFEFDDFLRKNQVDQLLITGMAAEECVDRTCRGALNRKYAVTVISDAIAGRSNESRKKKINDYERYGAHIVQAQTLLEGQSTLISK